MDTPRTHPGPRSLIPGPALALGGILLLSLALNLWNNGFPLGYHRDEPKKVRFILEGRQDFHHPLMMLQQSRVVNRVLGLDEKQDVVALGRTLSGVNGTLTVLFLFLLARRRLGRGPALWAALAAAASPILVVHAHYLKEDVLLTLFCTLTLYALSRFLDRPDRGPALILGLSAGLAASSHFKAGFLFPVLAAAPILGSFTDRRRLYRGLLLACAAAAAVFLAVNYPILSGLRESRLLSGLDHDLRGILEGKEVQVHALPQLFTFHLRASLLPGMTWGAAAIGIVGTAAALWHWRTLEAFERALLLYLALFYFSVEATPFKPYPDFMRYTMPLVPVLLYFGVRWAASVPRSLPAVAGRLAGIAFLALLIAAPLQASLRLDYHLTRDTRAEAARQAQALGGRVVFGNYASAESHRMLIDEDPDSLRADGATHLCVASFDYDRYFQALSLPGQKAGTLERARRYQALFRYPHVEIRPAYRSFAFSNPVIRILDIRSGPEKGPR